MRGSIGKRLREMREAVDLEIPAVSKRTGISAGEIQIIEAGQLLPSPGELRGFARAYKVDFLELMILAGHMTRKDVARYQERPAA